jgi:hypothetical protein
MAFVLKQSTSYKWPIKLIIPTDGGRQETHTFDGEFKRLPQSRLNEVMKLARDVERGRADADEVEDQGLARELLIGWSGVVDDAGKEIPFSESAMTQLVEIPMVAGQVIKHFFESIKSEKEPGKRKNF